MTYPSSGLTSPLDDNRRRLLADLEASQQPTQYARGALAALSMAALTSDERSRVDALKTKWSNQG